MSKRLQVVLAEDELRDIQRAARARKLTVAEWVRQELRDARQREAQGDPGKKLAAIRAAARHGYPTADIEQMLHEIHRGRGIAS